jgi:hypothetical protein
MQPNEPDSGAAMTADEKRMIKCAAAVPLAVALLSGVAAAVSPYLPETSAWYQSCRQTALADHAGEVVRVSTRPVDGSTLIKLFIEQADGRELVVVCDGPSGKILRTVSVDQQ